MKEHISWFVMRDLKRSNAKQFGYQKLQEESIEVFTPLKERIIIKRGKHICEKVPVVSDLLFVRSSYDALESIIEKVPTIQHRYQRGKRYREPMIIKDADMEKFILAVNNAKTTHYYLPQELTPEMYGKQIRIVGGELDSYEGRLLKCRGSRVKHMLVELSGLLVAKVEVDPSFIEFI